MRIPAIHGLLLALLLSGAAAADYTEVYPEEGDPFTGNYVGRWSEAEDVDPEVSAQVIPLGRDRYMIRVAAKLDMRCPPKFVVEEAEAEDGAIEFREGPFHGRIADGKITGGRGRAGTYTFTMEKVELASPSLGAAPPEGAIVLYGGDSLDAWDQTDGWRILEDGTLLVTPEAEDLKTKQLFGDCRLHVEFRTAYMPRSRGQQRSNSGVIVQDEYEVQVLDSFGLEGYYDECGALYKVSAPHVNACRPPLQWQTYDIEFRAARFDDQGNVTAYPRMTVHHNGVRIQADEPLPWRTAWKEKDRLQPPPTQPGHIKLQSHSNYVQFRNIWVVDLAAE